MTYITMFLAFSRLPGSDPLAIYVIPANNITSPETIVAAYLIKSYITVSGAKISSKSASVAAMVNPTWAIVKSKKIAINRILRVFRLVGYGFCAIVKFASTLFCLDIFVLKILDKFYKFLLL